MADTYRILVVCTGNVCRSPMAEGFIKSLLAKAGKDHVIVESAGTHAPVGCSPSAYAIEAAAELGIDIRDNRATYLDGPMLEEADLILVMQQSHKDHIHSLWPKESAGKVRLLRTWHPVNPSEEEITDPIGASRGFYRRVARLMMECSEGLVDQGFTGAHG